MRNNLNLTEHEILEGSTPFNRGRRTCHVYFLIYKGIIVYVGKAVNYDARIAQHCDDKAFDSFYVTECDESELKRVESFYIKMFGPFYNVSENLRNQAIPNNTYIKHEDVILMNAGGNSSDNRMILHTKGDTIFNAFTNERIGFVVNKIGFIYNRQRKAIHSPRYAMCYKIIRCKDLATQDIEVTTSMDIFDLNSNTCIVSVCDPKNFYYSYDFYIYSKLFGLTFDWFKSTMEEKGLAYNDDMLSFIDKILDVKKISIKIETMVNKDRKPKKSDIEMLRQIYAKSQPNK